jgi:nitrate reductase gamma subunit
MDDRFLFGVLPYVTLGLGLLGLTARALLSRPTEVRLAERRAALKGLLWGSVSWRLGITGVLLGHLLGLLIPRGVLVWNQHPLRLVVLEVTGFALGSLTVVGLALSLAAPRLYRRRSPLSTSDSVLLTLLATSVVSGLGIAVFDRWGSSWYASLIVPYLRSLVRMTPQVGRMADMPFLVKLHVVSAFALVGVVPFTRLAVLAVLPVAALRRRSLRRSTNLHVVDAR